MNALEIAFIRTKIERLPPQSRAEELRQLLRSFPDAWVSEVLAAAQSIQVERIERAAQTTLTAKGFLNLRP